MSQLSPQWEYLCRWLFSSDDAPPMLLSGISADITTALTDVAALAMCERTGVENREPCHECSGCQLMRQGTHPDIITAVTQKATWVIKDFRTLLATLAITPRNHRRLVIIRDIDMASLPAANILLKSLEEPQATTRFILTTQWPRRLLPTILSRCYHIRYRLTASPEKSNPEAKPTAEDSPPAIDTIADALGHQLREHGPSPQLRRAFMRLRDYYLITSRHGNSKLAQEVLLLSLPLQNGIARYIEP